LNKHSFIFVYLFFLPLLLHGQNCDFRIQGKAIDEVTHLPLAFATIYLESSGKSVLADENGYFVLDKVCSGNTHVRVSHVSCEPLRLFLNVQADTVLNLFLHHHEELMDEIRVHGKKTEAGTELTSTLDSDLIIRETNKDLSNILAGIVGVSQLKTGAGISKPVIHGLYGNRVALLNNGVSLAGQQWGNDHAPEIDAYAADHISVVKGVAALAYPGQSLGGIVLIEPAETNDDPHFHGGFNYIFQSNGLGNTLNGKIEKGGENRAFWFKGTLKRHGDLKTPAYYLTNTGKSEADAAFMAEFGKHKTWTKKIYISSFNTELGILRGAHVGNLTDLESAIGREVPFFTEDKFSYKINAPSQKVNHQLLKLSTRGSLSGNRIVQLNYGLQLNSRREYDVRRGGRTQKPSLSLRQWSQQLDFSYEKSFKDGHYLKAGFWGQSIDNTNVPETGILPLIPDFVNLNESIFLIYQKSFNKLTTEIGARANFSQYNVRNISRDLPRRVERNKHVYQNLSFSAGASWGMNDKLKISFNGGYAGRPPAINELYSFGLHQGVSSIEIGSPDMQVEHSLKGTVAADLRLNQRVFLQVLGYYQYIRDYIFLRPSDQPELTIRGAFPVFYYDQTDAEIKGIDILFSTEPVKFLRLVSKVALLRGNDIRNKLPLVYMPSNNLDNRLDFNFEGTDFFEHPQFSLGVKTVFRQNHLNIDQDFLVPPPTYNLVSLGLGCGIHAFGQFFKAGVQVENLLNTKYRDYLNRQRYFSDEMGRSFNARINWEF
jgi:iron complex outermembrane receptor protein